MNVISASRRTDLPAFYWTWFMNRVHAGFCDVANPFNARQVRRVSLRPEGVTAIVFWTRDATWMLRDVRHLEALGFAFYVHYTISGYPRELEPGPPEAMAAVATLRALAERIGPERVIWRYDPILLGSRTPTTYHVEVFARLARALAGCVRSSTVSLYDDYLRTRLRLAELAARSGWSFDDGEREVRATLVGTLATIAGENGMQLQSCGEPDLDVPGVRPGRCVDPELLSRLRPDLELCPPPHPSRPGCGCVKSVDIGAYGMCTHGCVYCYANRSAGEACRRRAQHDPSSASVEPGVGRGARSSCVSSCVLTPLPVWWYG